LIQAERAIAQTQFVKGRAFKGVLRGVGIAAPVLAVASFGLTYINYHQNEGMAVTESLISAGIVSGVSYLGSIVGAQLGARAGAAAGSAVPVIGTGIGALVGGAIGAFAGGWLGGEGGEAGVSFGRPWIEASARRIDEWSPW